jgi:sugar/nucleoside kinase (ribokinase family)
VTNIDYLAIGHITQDIIPGGRVTGGTVAYSGRTAAMLGCKTAVLSSAAPDFDWRAALPGIQVESVPAAETTTFQNIYAGKGRIQYLHGRAHDITTAHVPPTWQRPAIVHLAPLANELAPNIIDLFGLSLVGITLQGWLRDWDKNGRIHPCAWPAAAQVLPKATVVILSSEDLLDETMLNEYRQLTHLLVLTQGAAGCTVFMGDESRQIPAPAVTEVEATGAGDIFAAVFLVRLWQTAGNPWEAARFANKIAAQSVAQRGLDAKIEYIKNVIA